MGIFIQVHDNIELAALVMVAESYLHFNSLSHPIYPALTHYSETLSDETSYKQVVFKPSPGD